MARVRLPTFALPAMWLGVSSCGTTPFEPIELDIATNCNEVQVTAIATDLQTDQSPWTQILAAAHRPTRSDAHAMWIVGKTGTFLRAWYWHDGTISAVDLANGEDLDGPLRIYTLKGDVSSDVWVVRDDPSRFRVWRIAITAGDPVLLGASSFLDFPAQIEGCVEPCDRTTWPKTLAFVQGRPHIVTLAPLSPDSVFNAWWGEIADDGLSLLGDGHLREPMLHDPPEARPFQFVTLAAEQFPRETDWNMSFVARPEEPTEYDLDFLFVLTLGADSPADAIDPTITPLGPDLFQEPVGIVTDRLADYLLLGTPELGPYILRLEARGPLLVPRGAYLLPPAENYQLMALAGDFAVGDVSQGRWVVLKPSLSGWSETIYETDAEVTAFAPANLGSFLVDKAQGGPDLVRVECVRPPGS